MRFQVMTSTCHLQIPYIARWRGTLSKITRFSQIFKHLQYNGNMTCLTWQPQFMSTKPPHDIHVCMMMKPVLSMLFCVTQRHYSYQLQLMELCFFNYSINPDVTTIHFIMIFVAYLSHFNDIQLPLFEDRWKMMLLGHDEIRLRDGVPLPLEGILSLQGAIDNSQSMVVPVHGHGPECRS